MKKVYVISILIIALSGIIKAQTGTEFWFAAPEVTAGHNDTCPMFRFTNTSAIAGTVTITQPANPAFITVPNPILVPANGTVSIRLDKAPNNYKALIENLTPNIVYNKGLLITSTVPITAYYEVNNSNNNEIFALKGANALGTEFYIPITQNSMLAGTLYNQTGLAPLALSTFDIVATQNATSVIIYSRVPVDGHLVPNTPFTITLNRGQTYSCGFSGANYQNPVNQPSGAVVISDKPIAITVKEDSKRHNPSGGCYDLIGDQIVPVDIIGTDYIVIKGQVNAGEGESFFILATQNNTKVYLDGNPVAVKTLFAGETYFQDNIPNNRYYIHTDKPVYCTQVTGFGCELGSALLPPLNCAGSKSVSFVRSTTEAFYLNIMVKAGNQGNFTLTGGSNPLCITAADFAVVPGTGGMWLSTFGKQFSLLEVPQGVAMKLTNSTDVFGMGLINGAGTTGCRYGFFSEFAAKIIVNAGADFSICGNTTASLNGSVTGGAITGIWTSSGTGTFSPDATTLNATYNPSTLDTIAGSVILTLTSTSSCFPVSDQVILTITDAPWITAGPDASVCINNPNYTLSGHVSIAGGAQWSGGGGTFTPNNLTLAATYNPTAAELATGNVTLTLTSIINGTCNAVSDNIIITYTNAPTANAGPDVSVCANNQVVSLNGAVTISTGGIWSGGTGSFVPGNTALNNSYTPSPGEIGAGNVTLTLTTTGNGNCSSVSDNITISITTAPTVNAGVDQTKCKNNNIATLAGNTTVATGGVWSGGTGLFTPNNTTLNATYTPTAGELASGFVNLTLTTTGNANCSAVSDQMVITYTSAPTVSAGVDQTKCANNSITTLAGTITGATGAIWSGGLGAFLPNNTTLNASYTPTAADILAGTKTLTLTTTGNGLCVAEVDQMIITFTSAPTANAGLDRTICGNNPTITLNGAITIATGATWSGGGGTFNPNPNTLNATYTPTAGEVATGFIDLTLTTTGNGTCVAASDIMRITYTASPTSNAGIDQTKCKNNNITTLTGAVTIATGGIWSGGTGVFAPNNTTLGATYTPTAGELAAGFVNLTLTTSGNGTCNSVSDIMVITYSNSPTVSAGVDQTKCANNSVTTLTGVITGATGAIWSGGLGVFLPNANTLNATYTPTAADILAGTKTLTLTTTGNGLCVAEVDQMIITFTPSPTVNAGVDRTICGNNPIITLNGSITIATGATWTGGGGTLSPNPNTLNATYNPTVGEVSTGFIDLTLTTTGNGTCIAASDIMRITYTAAPTANAGVDQTKCKNNSVTTLAGVVTIATGGIWSGGTGVYTPNNTTLNATYTPTAGELAAGFINLTLTTTGNGTCISTSDVMVITFTNAPIVSAGIDQTKCANNAVTTLAGTISGATGGTWSGGAGTYFLNANTLTANYTPTAAEIAAGTLTLTLTTTGNGLCIAETNQMIITFTPAPTVNAGVDRTICGNNPTITLNGAITIATGATWSGGGGTFSPNPNTLNATYTPTVGEISTGFIDLTLTTTGNGSCIAASDIMRITYTAAPTANAGVDQTKCKNNNIATLAGVVTIATGGIWSGGTGVFTPNAATLNATYTPSAAELLAGLVNLTLTTTGNGTCNATSDIMVITYSNAPTVNAGVDQTKCANNAVTTLAGAFTGATGTLWSGGAGIFLPNATTLNATYTPTAAEILAGTRTLTLSTTGNGLCVAEVDQMIITFTPAPTTNAGLDRTVCGNNANVILNGTFTVATGVVWSGGSGSFAPGSTSVNATYTPTAGEISSGFVNLTLTTTGNGTCNTVTDVMRIDYTTPPTSNAGPDQTKCKNNSITTLAGSITIASGGTWSGGTGVYAPNANTLNATYTPSAAELLAGLVNLTLSTTGNGTCIAVTDVMTITFTAAPTVNAGVDQTKCGNNAVINLSGTITGATGGTWSGGTGTYAPNANLLITNYTPSAAEITAGVANLTLTTTGNSNCAAENDNMMITITPAPVVNAGIDVTVCANNATVNLNGSVTVATGGQWTGGSGSYNPGSTALAASYSPSIPEISAGQVWLTLTSTGNGTCIAVSDLVKLSFTSAPVVNAGTDQVKCSNNNTATLAGSVIGATGGLWSGGLGLFLPNNTNLAATYSPTAAELAAGFANIILTSTGNGTCLPVTDNVAITYTGSPTVDAGPNQTVGANNSATSLNGNVIGATGGSWSGGSGTYAPSNSALNAIYTPSASEITAGTVTLTLTSIGNGTCNPVSDFMTITINAAPIVNAGFDVVACVNNPAVTLLGSVQNAAGGIWSGGTGVFNPGNTALNVVYTPTPVEIANGTLTLTLSSTGNGTNNAVSDNIVITFSASPIANAGGDRVVCSNNANIVLTGSVVGASGGQWTGGLGLYSPNASTLNATYTPTATEIATGTVTLTLTTTGNGTCNSVTDQMVITFTPSPTANAGPDKIACSNNSAIAINGNISVATGSLWSGGSGVYTPNTSSLNITYAPSAAEIATGNVVLTLTTTGNGTCLPVNDQVLLSITPGPIVNAGSNQAACFNNPSIPLSGLIQNAGGGVWTGGTGTFNPSNTTLNATYIPTIAELSSGNITLTLTSTVNGSCFAETDNMSISISAAPIVNANIDQTVCANNASINLNGTVSGATGGQWTGGLGSFIPSNNSLNAVYIPTAGEIASGSLTLALTSTGNGTCNPVIDNLTITFTGAPTVDAGNDILICANNPIVALSGAITVASGAIWTGGAGNYNPNNTNLTANYTPSAAEIAAGQVTLTLTTNGNGTCLPVNDQVTIFISPAPQANAGPDITACANNATVTLNGNIMNAGGGAWSGGGGTYNPSNIIMNATYTPSAAEIAAGQIILTLTSTGNGNCNAVSDQVKITFNPAPNVNAGLNQTVCSNNNIVTLGGFVNNAGGGQWTNGLGLFTPNNTILNSTYSPTLSDLSVGFVDLILTTTGNGTCLPAKDTMRITYTTAPTVSAGVDQTVCANNSTVSINGNITVATGGHWTGGTGIYSPNANTVDISYTPSATEISSGSVDLTLTSVGNGQCIEVVDIVHIIITQSPIVIAGPDIITCVDDLIIDVNGFIAGPTTTGIWTTTGTGYFTPINTALTAIYHASPADSVAGTVNLILTSTNNNLCLPVSDTLTVNILPAGLVNAGSDFTVCANNSVVFLNGSISGGATTGIWTTSGSGVFVPDHFTLNATYIPSATDTAIGNITLTLTANSCNFANDAITLTITDAPFINAGIDKVVCVDNLNIPLSGIIYGATTTGFWTTSGTGTFTPNNTTLNATYHASTLDSLNLGVILVLHPTNFGNCIGTNDTMHITILPPGIVSAGQDQTLCANNGNVQLNGSISGGASQGIWATSGSGTFNPNATTLNAIYIPSSADTTTGNVTLALTATNSCNFAMDILQINFSPAPTADAGVDQSVCANNSTVNLSGSVTISTGGQWSTTGTGTFTANINNLINTYIPSAFDLSLGSSKIILTTTGNGGCSQVTDTMNLTFTPSPVVNAGVDQHVCSTGGQTNLYGIINGGASAGVWTSLGDGNFIPSNNVLNAIYVFGSADITNGTANLVLTTTDHGNCIVVSDTIKLFFGNSVFVYAGPDKANCVTNPTVVLNNTIITGGSTTGLWTTSGTGSFTPSATSLNAVYTLSSLDSLNGGVELYLTSTANGGCLPGNDTVIVDIQQLPIANAGPDANVCLGIDQVSVNGSIANANGGLWTTTGTGTFMPTDTSLSVAYYPSASDSIIGHIVLTLITTGNSICPANSDNMNINLIVPLAPAFSFTTPCLNVPVQFTDLSSVISGTITGWQWTFDGSNTDLNQNPTYTFNTTGTHSINLTVSSSLGCSYFINRNIYVNPLPAAAFTSSTQCLFDQVVFTDASSVLGGNINNWSWNFGDTTFSVLQNPVHLYDTSGVFDVSLIATSDSGCVASVTIPTTVYPPPIAGFSFIGNCSNFNVNFTDTSSINNLPITSWHWNFGNGQTSNIQNPQISYADSGTYQVQLIVGASTNCTDTITQMVPVTNAFPGFNYSYNCVDYHVLFTDTSEVLGAAISTWYWSFGDGNTSNNQNPTYLYSDTGSYNVELIISTPYCTDTTSQNIRINTLFTNFNYTYNCQSYSVNFSDQSIFSGFGPSNWQWNFGDGNTGTSQNPLHQYADTGVYNVQLIAQTSANCVDTISSTVSIFNVKANFSVLNSCIYDSVRFTDITNYSHGVISSWKWNFGDSFTSTLQNPSHLFQTNGTFNASMIIQTAEGCIDTIIKPITIYPSPVASFTVSALEYQVESQITFTDASTGAGSWNWNFGDNFGTSTNQKPTYAYLYPGNYMVSEVVKNEFGCSDTATQAITISKNDEVYSPVLPTGFTPNGDGVNDSLVVRGGPFTDLLFNVYNEWGNLIYSTTDSAIGWDGTFHGVEQPIGVYVYTIKATAINNREYKVSGEITLIR